MEGGQRTGPGVLPRTLGNISHHHPLQTPQTSQSTRSGRWHMDTENDPQTNWALPHSLPMRESQGTCAALLLSPASQLFPEPPQEGLGTPFYIKGRRTCPLPCRHPSEASAASVPTLWAGSGLVVAATYLDHKPECRGCGSS